MFAWHLFECCEAWVQWQQPDLFAVLQVAMGFCKETLDCHVSDAFFCAAWVFCWGHI